MPENDAELTAKAAIKDHLADREQFATDYYNDAYLDRRIDARVRRVGAEDYGEYLDILRSDRTEEEQLLDFLSVNVTSFFRNPDVWDRIRTVLEELTADGRTRVWSAACADGREPYSIAMLALDDPDINDRNLDITATDIDADTLETAREGVYETTQTTDIQEELAPIDDYDQFIDQDGDRFAVRDRVKRTISFEQHDLIHGEPMRDFDLVLCRNLLIYIDREYKEPIFETLHGSLDSDGYLVIGMTETLPRGYRDVFETVDKRLRVYRNGGE
ncbi:MAG: protein-glutamate O-methyltransferase CheR [Halobacteriales archaeon]|nr:protein-glutamate O-methyltransferase CheR [Halobacteriales archaeon]